MSEFETRVPLHLSVTLLFPFPFFPTSLSPHLFLCSFVTVYVFFFSFSFSFWLSRSVSSWAFSVGCVWNCRWLLCTRYSVCVLRQGVGQLQATSTQAPLALFVCLHVFVCVDVSLSLVCVCVYMCTPVLSACMLCSGPWEHLIQYSASVRLSVV